MMLPIVFWVYKKVTGGVLVRCLRMAAVERDGSGSGIGRQPRLLLD
jgi:hypothetical protein